MARVSCPTVLAFGSGVFPAWRPASALHHASVGFLAVRGADFAVPILAASAP